MSISVDPDWWQTLFDEVYLQTDARSVCDEDLTRREINVFSELIPMRHEQRILDLCGGHGRHALELCRRGFTRCTVLDYSYSLLSNGAQRAVEENFPVSFTRGDARSLQMADACLDHVLILGNSLGYITDPDADFSIISETYRVLKRNGWLLLDVTDGNAVKARFTPLAWHEIGSDIVVCRQRELDGDVICAREMVISKKHGLVRDKTYSIRLYSPDSLSLLAHKVGFADIRLHTEFSPHRRKEDYGFMNHRMILTAQKP